MINKTSVGIRWHFCWNEVKIMWSSVDRHVCWRNYPDVFLSEVKLDNDASSVMSSEPGSRTTGRVWSVTDIHFIPSIPCSGLNYTLGWGLARQRRCSDLPGGDFHGWPQNSAFVVIPPHIWCDVQHVDLPAEMLFASFLPTRSETEAKGAHGVFGFSDVETSACGMKFPVSFNVLQDCAPT